MPLQQVALSNTFDEFRSTFNNAANTINSWTDYSGNLSVDTIASSNVQTSNLAVSALTNGRIVFTSNTIGPLVGTDWLTDSSGLAFNSTTNALTVSGTSTSGNVSTGGTLSVTGAATLSSTLAVTSTSAFTGNVTVNTNKLTITASNGTITGANTANVYMSSVHANTRVYAGDQIGSFLAEVGSVEAKHAVLGVSSSNDAIDMAIVNQSTGTLSYAEFIAMNNAGNTDSGWISMGINGSNYNDSSYPITKKDDAYILYNAPQGTTGTGDLIIGSGSYGSSRKIIFGAGGFATGNTQMQIEPDTRVYINIPTSSTSTTTGALVVNGGMGIAGNLNVGGNVTITGAISLQGSGNTVSTSSLSVANSLLFLAANNNADILDFGVIGEYKYGATTKYAGFVRDATDGIYKLFANNSATPANTVNFSGTGVLYAPLVVGSANVANTTASSSTTTGALTVAGGLGVAGSVYSGVYLFDQYGNLRSIAPNAQSGSYTLVIADNGRFINTTAGVTVPPSVFAIGDNVTIYNNSASSITITQGSTVTLRQAGTSNTGNRTLALRGVCTILCVASNEFVINGGGVT